ncbi:MAG: glycosyltransferase family 4 protein [Lacunisphaera sp.]
MPETGFSFSQLESPAPGTSLPEGRHWLRGWVWPKAGGHFVDVRARVGERVFPGVHGFPRADLAAHFATRQPHALAEFHIAVELVPGPAEVVLEVLEIEGRWSIFQTAQFLVSAAVPPVNFAVPSGPLRWHEFSRALQLLLKEQRRQPSRSLAELAQEIVAAIPYPRDLRHPPAPFHGHLDEPAAVGRSSFGRCPVLGYLFHESQPIARVLATFDLQAWQAVDHLLPSPQPGGYFPQFPFAKNCGLNGMIDVPAQLPNPVSLRLYAELADGSLQLCTVQRSRLVTNEEDKAPYAARTTTQFQPARDALNQAMSSRGMTVVNDEAMATEMARLENDFRTRAPASAAVAVRLNAEPLTSNSSVPRRILVVSHTLDLEGAPLFLVDYVAHLSSRGATITVLSPVDGPLRHRFETIGAKIILADPSAIFTATSKEAASRSIAALPVDFSPYDLVVCNTFTTFWAVHAAKKAGRRVLLYVHESTTPASFYHSRVHPSVITLVEEAFGLADAVSFTTCSTRNYHTDYGRPSTHRLTHGWIDVARIDAWRSQNSREDLRARFSLQAGELLVTNVGTVSGRKGQHIFARAVDLLWQRHPALAARTKFVMLGGRNSAFDAMLRDLLSQLNRANLIVHQETADYFPYYAAADLFVCSSYEESSPRVILETMACNIPILSSNVQGVPELVRADLEATLIPPGDTVALCEAMAQLLLSPEIGRSLAARARARVVAEFESAVLLPRHAALAIATAATPDR